MVKSRTKGVVVKVECRYLESHSDPAKQSFFFVYFITIINDSDKSIQLLKRRWNIFDSLSEPRIVEGEGVVGETPVLHPGEEFQYNSGCNLMSEFGYMEGYYMFQDLNDESFFDVEIPRFLLVSPAKLN